MSTVRIIARLDIKGPSVIKGIQMEGLRVVGDPQQLANDYYLQGADELFYQDLVASLYRRNNLTEIVKYTTENIFIPLTVAGGMRTVDDVRGILRAGADKVAINTGAIERPELIKEVSGEFGAQCMVLSIEAKQTAPNQWECYTDMGRQATGLEVLNWARRGEELGAGEIILTSIDRDGTRKGFDIPLVRAVSKAVSIPVIASGGFGNPGHLKDIFTDGCADAVAIAGALHFKKYSLIEVKDAARQLGISVRESI